MLLTFRVGDSEMVNNRHAVLNRISTWKCEEKSERDDHPGLSEWGSHA